MRSRIWLSAAVAAVFLTGLVSTSEAGPRRSSVCDIARHPQRYDGRDVTVSGKLYGGSMHGYVVVDTACGRGIQFGLLPEAKTDSTAPLNALLRDPNPPNVDIEVTFSGKISVGLDHSFPGPPRRLATLQVDRIDDLRVYRLARPRAQIESALWP